MEYLIGAIFTMALFLCFVGGYYVGQQHNKPVGEPVIPEEEIRKAERLKKEFSDMMGYNLNKALERRPR